MNAEVGGSTPPSPPLSAADLEGGDVIALEAMSGDEDALTAVAPSVGGSSSPLAPQPVALHFLGGSSSDTVPYTSSPGQTAATPLLPNGDTTSADAVFVLPAVARGELLPLPAVASQAAASTASLVATGVKHPPTAATDASQVLLAAPSVASVEEGASEEQVVPPATPIATSPVDTTTLAVGELPPGGTVAPIEVLRCSSRNAVTADVHTLHKVERMAAKKNLEFPGNSFTSFLDSKVLANLGRIGINLVTSDVVSIKNLEVDRLVLCANEKKGSTKSRLSNLESDDERESQIDEILSHTCGNLNENLLEKESDQIIDLSPLRRRKKYNNANNTMKDKLPKKSKTPSKIKIK